MLTEPIRIGTIVKGSADALRREPILVGYGEARSPLCLDRNMADIFIEYIRRGLPQTLDTMPNAGATGPVTAAGLLALAAADRARELWSALPEPVLDDDRRRAVEAVVRHAARGGSGTAPEAVSRS
jgi:hypothetical protein